ncbi:MAG: GatB/YqeY domain-containing protein [Thermoleophilia bacterium]|nr:GatB/YqeY domain-containing protein [Thermoleophilia bacterium]
MIERIEVELKEAMRARDAVRRSTLRLTLTALRAAEKELDRPLRADEELQVLQRERKRRLESVRAFREAGREEQAAGEEQELRVLEELLPEPLSEAELERIVENAIAETGATSLRDLGRVMADVMPQVAGRADGSVVSQLVRELLA